MVKIKTNFVMKIRKIFCSRSEVCVPGGVEGEGGMHTHVHMYVCTFMCTFRENSSCSLYLLLVSLAYKHVHMRTHARACTCELLQTSTYVNYCRTNAHNVHSQAFMNLDSKSFQ